MEKNTNYTIELLRTELNETSEDLSNLISESKKDATILDKLEEDFNEGLISKEKLDKIVENCKKNNKERLVRFDRLVERNNAIEDIALNLLKELQTA